ncbi:MAG: lytic transglycosylase domain-containing protein [Roseomonas sp.]|nr:lytic transglycosylase domain-containing protein [Roseomonas sp.]
MHGFRLGYARFLALGLLLAVLSACADGTGRHANGPFYNRPDSTSPPGPPGDPWGPWIRDASRRFDVPDLWIREVMRQESGGRPGATSRVGAMGLMQVMPGTYRELAQRYNLGPDPYHPYDNLQAGAAYIREMYQLYGSPAFLAAYNAGPRRLEDFLWGGRGLPDETRNYVARVGPRIASVAPARRAPAEVYAAADIGTSIARGPRRMDGGTMVALNEQRSPAPTVQVAQAAAPAPAAPAGTQVASLGNVVRMDPIPDGSTFTPAERRRAGLEPGRSSLAAAPVAPPAPRQAPAAAPSRSGLGLIGSAQAAPASPSALGRAGSLPPPSGGGNGWSVSLGRFASENLARSAASSARSSAGGSGQAEVVRVAQGNGAAFTARVKGLTRTQAEQTCQKLRSTGNCTLVAPGA